MSAPALDRTATGDGATAVTDLAVGGMTCGACANRIERKLNKLDGVSASVNYATERAHVSFPEGLSTDDLLATVAAAGYGASLPVTAPATTTMMMAVTMPPR